MFDLGQLLTSICRTPFVGVWGGRNSSPSGWNNKLCKLSKKILFYKFERLQVYKYFVESESKLTKLLFRKICLFERVVFIESSAYLSMLGTCFKPMILKMASVAETAEKHFLLLLSQSFKTETGACYEIFVRMFWVHMCLYIE